MNPELQKALAEWLKAALDVTQNVASQIPPMLWEKVLYGRIVATSGTLFAVVLFLVVGRLLYLAGRDSEDVRDIKALCGIGRAVGLIGPLITLLAGIPYIVEAWLAPRVYLMEWLKSLLR